jgi:hypothetical protein
MEELIKKLLEPALPRHYTEEELWKAQELLDEYIDGRIKRALDQEFERGEYSRW